MEVSGYRCFRCALALCDASGKLCDVCREDARRKRRQYKTEWQRAANKVMDDRRKKIKLMHSAEWARKNKDRSRDIHRRCEERAREECSERYVRDRMARGTALKPEQIPQMLVEAKVEQLRIKRLLKELKSEKR